MGIDIRLPNINGKTERERLAQVESYLVQFVQQLQWGLNQIETMSSSSSSVTPSSVSAAPSVKPAPSAEATFNSIKALIIKSADIVNAYYEEINKKLVGEYVAQSDFGTFQETTTGQFSATSTNILQAYTDIQTIVTTLDETKTGIGDNLKTISDDVDQLDKDLSDAKDNFDAELEGIKGSVSDVNTTILAVTANLKTGKLYEKEDGTPVYGLEVGQRNTVDGVEVFNKFARFTADRLSFYDLNGSEVAYISDYKLYITDAEVKGSLTLGAFLIDTTNGFRLKWVGRG